VVALIARCTRLNRAAIVCVAVLGACCPDSLYEIRSDHPTVRLPLDEAPHCYGAEWWYYTGHLVTDEGRGYGIEAVVFHLTRLPLTLQTDGWAAHFAVLDEATGSFLYDQVQQPEPATMGGPEPGGFDLQTSLVQMAGSEGQDRIQAAMTNGYYAVDLTLSDERGAVVYDDGGYVPFGRDGHSFYYSRPRMSASGTMHIGGQSHTVTGELWFDRQWGHSLKTALLRRWVWFSLRLDDGSDVMLYVFRGRGEPRFGTYIPKTGEPVVLASEDFVITPKAFWKSPHTGATYPVQWDIRIIPQDFTLSVKAVANDQELDVRASTYNVYWEGQCTLTGTQAGQPVTGRAYVELTNYLP
jgi:predicted secreted hydrolase